MNADERRLKRGLLNLRLSAFICGFTLLLCGCSPPPATKPPYAVPTEPMYDVIKAINQNNSKLPTMWASISKMELSLVDENHKRHTETLSGSLLYRSPRNV